MESSSVGIWPEFRTSSNSVNIVLDDEEHPLLAADRPDSFRSISRLFSLRTHVFWITLRRRKASATNYYSSLISGFARTARFENEALSIVFLELDLQYESVPFNHIVSILQKSFGLLKSGTFHELEYRYESGHIMISRLIADGPTDAWLSENIDKVEIPDPTLQASSTEPNAPDCIRNLRFNEDNSFKERLSDSEIEITVKAVGLTSRNAKDSFDGSEALLIFDDMSGRVRSVGKNYAHKFQIGDRVACAFPLMPFANVIRVNGSIAARLPESVHSFVDACSIPSVYLTAYYSLTKASHLEKGQTVLVHRLDNVIGQALISIAQHLEAEIFSTVESEKQREWLAYKFHLDESHVLLIEEGSDSLKSEIWRLTDGRGLDVAIGNSIIEEIADSIAPFGTLICLDTDPKEGQRHLSMRSSITITPFDLRELTEHRPEMVENTLAEIMKLVEQGKLTPLEFITKMNWRDVENALSLVSQPENLGKIIIGVTEQSDDETLHSQPQDGSPQGGSTCILAGGLGGLGQEMCNFLATCGFSHLLILTSRNLDAQERATWERKLSRARTKVHVLSCKIDMDSDVGKTANYCAERLPPVSVVINAAVVWRSVMVNQMTPTEFFEGIAPKVSGTRNLYNAFKDSLESFILLSSVTSIVGSEGQGNYGAANSFLDSFAVAYAGPPTKIISLNLGPIFEAGALTQRTGAESIFSRQDISGVTLKELFALLAYVLDGHALKNRRRQIVIGFNSQPVLDLDTLETMPDPRFLHLSSPEEKFEDAKAEQAPVRIEDAVAAATTFEAIYEVILGAFINKIAHFTVLEPGEGSLTRPLVDLGLDSLVVTEIKNWISRTFQVDVNTAEISDAPSIRILVQTLTQRRTGSTQATDSEKPTLNGHVNGAETVVDTNSSSVEALPILPLPTLEETFNTFLESIRAFGSDAEVAQTQNKIEKFLTPGGIGRCLQGRLEEREAQSDNWLVELSTKSNWLNRRACLVPYSNFFGTHPVGAFPHGQAERAALITITAAQYRDDLINGSIKPSPSNDAPTCGDLYKNVFNAVRRPKIDSDEFIKYRGNDYAIALRYGRIFKVPLKENGSLAPLEKLLQVFWTILKTTRDPSDSPVGILTSDRRSSWAKVRRLYDSECSQLTYGSFMTIS